MASGLRADDKWYLTNVVVAGPNGLHARPIVKILDSVRGYEGGVFLTNLNNGRRCDARNPMSLMLLDAVKGNEVEIRIEKNNDRYFSLANSIVKIVADSEKSN